MSDFVPTLTAAEQEAAADLVDFFGSAASDEALRLAYALTVARRWDEADMYLTLAFYLDRAPAQELLDEIGHIMKTRSAACPL